jgi:hypothetical protein
MTRNFLLLLTSMEYSEYGLVTKYGPVIAESALHNSNTMVICKVKQ